MALDKLTLLDETVVNNTATSTSNTIFTDRYITYKNKIINGNFDIWQRGTSLGSGTGGRFLADRWFQDSSTTTYTVSQQSFSLGQTSVPNEPTYFYRTVVFSVAGVNSYCLNYYKIESVRTFTGKTATLSFWAKADSNKNIAIEFDQSFGSGGSPSSRITNIGVTTCSLTSSWQKFTVTTNIPSISGKTLGTSGNDSLGIIFWFDAGLNFNSRTNSLGQQSGTFDIAQVQLEEGSVATPFEMRPIGLELILCQRYYQTVFVFAGGGQQYYLTGAFGTTNVGMYKPISNIMRATPSSTGLVNNSNIETYTGSEWSASTLSHGIYGTAPNFELVINASSDSSGAGRLLRKTTSGDVTFFASAEL